MSLCVPVLTHKNGSGQLLLWMCLAEQNLSLLHRSSFARGQSSYGTCCSADTCYWNTACTSSLHKWGTKQSLWTLFYLPENRKKSVLFLHWLFKTINNQIKLISTLMLKSIKLDLCICSNQNCPTGNGGRKNSPFGGTNLDHTNNSFYNNWYWSDHHKNMMWLSESDENINMSSIYTSTSFRKTISVNCTVSLDISRNC